MTETELIQKLREAHDKYVETIRTLVKPEKAAKKVTLLVSRFEEAVRQIKSKEITEEQVLDAIQGINETVEDHVSLPPGVCSRPCLKAIFDSYGVVVGSLTARKADFQIIQKVMEVLGMMASGALVEGFANSHDEKIDRMDKRDVNHELFDELVDFMKDIGQGVQDGSIRTSSLQNFEADLEKLGLKVPDQTN